jgi:hypothetical protein
MMQYTETAKMFHKLDGYPNGDKLAGDGNQLQEEPHFLKWHFFDHAPGVVQRNEGLPWRYSCFTEHAIKTDMNTQHDEKKENPAHKQILMF